MVDNRQGNAATPIRSVLRDHPGYVSFIGDAPFKDRFDGNKEGVTTEGTNNSPKNESACRDHFQSRRLLHLTLLNGGGFPHSFQHLSSLHSRRTNETCFAYMP